MSFTYVSKTVEGDGAGSSEITIASQTFTAGRLYVAFIRWSGATGSTVTSIDFPNTVPYFTLGTKQQVSNGDGDFDHGMFAYAIAGSTDTQNPRANFSGSFAARAFHLWEYTIVGTPSVDVQSVTGNSTTDSSSLVSAAFNTTGTDELVLGGASFHQGGAGHSFNSHAINGSAADHAQNETSSDPYSITWDKTFAGTFTGGTATVTSTSARPWLVNAIAFKMGGGGGGGSVIPVFMNQYRLRRA